MSVTSIQVGQTWRLRNGTKTKIHLKLTPNCCPFAFVTPINGIFTAITEDGRCLHDKESPGDLVELVGDDNRINIKVPGADVRGEECGCAADMHWIKAIRDAGCIPVDAITGEEVQP